MLILVLAALALLVTALITASSLWAWLSIGASALAAVVLFVDWLRRRARQRKAVAEASDEPEGETADEADEAASAGDEVAATDVAADTATDAVADTSDTADTTDVDTAEPSPTAADTASAPPEPAKPERSAIGAYDPHTPPGEEDTDAADLLLVSELDDQVLVIDEQPRYHLPECGWLVDKDTIPIEVSEARELGFTPCARCGPDASLVTRARRKRKRSLGKFGRE